MERKLLLARYYSPFQLHLLLALLPAEKPEQLKLVLAVLMEAWDWQTQRYFQQS